MVEPEDAICLGVYSCQRFFFSSFLFVLAGIFGNGNTLALLSWCEEIFLVEAGIIDIWDKIRFSLFLQGKKEKPKS